MIYLFIFISNKKSQSYDVKSNLHFPATKAGQTCGFIILKEDDEHPGPPGASIMDDYFLLLLRAVC